MTVNTLGTDSRLDGSRPAGDPLASGSKRGAWTENRWPLLAICIALFSISALVYYHLHRSGLEPTTLLPRLFAGIYDVVGLAPSVIFFLMVAAWGAIWLHAGTLERPVARLGRLLMMAALLGVALNLGDGGVAEQAHKGAFGAWLARRLVDAIGFVPTMVLVWPATFASLMLATEWFFAEYFERLRQPGQAEVGVEAAVTDHLRGLSGVVGAAAPLRSMAAAAPAEPRAPQTLRAAAPAAVVDLAAAGRAEDILAAALAAETTGEVGTVHDADATGDADDMRHADAPLEVGDADGGERLSYAERRAARQAARQARRAALAGLEQDFDVGYQASGSATDQEQALDPVDAGDPASAIDPASVFDPASAIDPASVFDPGSVFDPDSAIDQDGAIAGQRPDRASAEVVAPPVDDPRAGADPREEGLTDAEAFAIMAAFDERPVEQVTRGEVDEPSVEQMERGSLPATDGLPSADEADPSPAGWRGGFIRLDGEALASDVGRANEPDAVVAAGAPSHDQPMVELGAVAAEEVARSMIERAEDLDHADADDADEDDEDGFEGNAEQAAAADLVTADELVTDDDLVTADELVTEDDAESRLQSMRSQWAQSDRQKPWVGDGEPSVAIPRPDAVNPVRPTPPAVRQQQLFGGADEALVQEAIELVVDSRRATAALLQRKLRVDYELACELLRELASRGVVALEGDASRARVLDG